MPTIRLQINVDNQTVTFNGNKLCLKISSKENNGLSIVDGKLVATKAPDGTPGSGGTMNTSGNAIGSVNASPVAPLGKICFNASVSRHQKYTGTDTLLRVNDGPVMSKLSGNTLESNKSVAAYMIIYAGG